MTVVAEWIAPSVALVMLAFAWRRYRRERRAAELRRRLGLTAGGS